MNAEHATGSTRIVPPSGRWGIDTHLKLRHWLAPGTPEHPADRWPLVVVKLRVYTAACTRLAFRVPERDYYEWAAWPKCTECVTIEVANRG